MLTLYKRHTSACKKSLNERRAKYKKPPFTHLELRAYKDCRCACYIEGVHPITEEYMRESLHTTSWEVAEELKTRTEKRGPEAVDVDAMSIQSALDIWINDHKRRGIASTTLRAHEGLRDKFLQWCQDTGIERFASLTHARVYEFVLTWDNSSVTNAQRLTRLTNFFEFAKKRKWIDKNPTDDIDGFKVIRKQVDPYTVEEIARIESVLNVWTGLIQTRRGNWSLRPSTFKCLVHLLRDTGLRIADALRVTPAMIEPTSSGIGGKVTIGMMKFDSEKLVTVYLTPQTVEELNEVPWISERYVFMEECATGEEDRNKFKEHLHSQATGVYDVLHIIGKVAKVANCRAHRFRHTLAKSKLEQGMLLEDVSRLLGHTSIKITEKFYAKWVKSRQQRLEELVIAQWKSARIIPALKDNRERRPEPSVQ